MFNKALTILACVLLAGCSTSYKTAPETTKVEVRVATAKRSTQEARQKAVDIQAATIDTQTASKTTAEHIEAALTAMGKSDYVTAAQELVLARASNELVQMILQQSLRNVVSLGKSLETTEHDLGESQEELQTVKKDIKKMAEAQAKAQAIVDEVNWGFRVGALLYFVKGLLAMGFWGIIILAVVLIVLLAIGGPCALFAMRIISWLGSIIKRK